MAGQKTFVGFGFGPIQSGLFLYEAFQSGYFSRYVVAEVNPRLVEAIRDNGGVYRLNVALEDGVCTHEISGVELYDPLDPAGRAALLDAISESQEMATCLPSINFYDIGESSVAKLLAEGLSRRDKQQPTIVYAAENHNHAAEELMSLLERYVSRESVLGNVRMLNTVIGKMSGVIDDPKLIQSMELETVTPELSQAILVEEFNRILISKVGLEGMQRGITCFQEKDDLLPFEEAKLYGHNAIHALIGYLADIKAYLTIAEAGQDRTVMDIARAAFLEECGGMLLRRHMTVDDPLFTPDGWRDYAEDLLRRMVNPHLHDLVARVGRDHVRKLGLEDRLYGTMRLCLEQGITPTNLADGAAAGIVSMILRADENQNPPQTLPDSPIGLTPVLVYRLLNEIWDGQEDEYTEQLIDLTWGALQTVKVV